MKLRELQMKDASAMLKWMHNTAIVGDLQTDFSSKTIMDCELFIKNSKTDKNNLHMAVTNEDDDYVGTVSLKNINKRYKSAEFAIVMTEEAIGKGYSSFAMKKILSIGLHDRNLNCIYWYVSKNNKRAIKFYNKNGYKKIEQFPNFLLKWFDKEQIANYNWYMIQKMSFDKLEDDFNN